MASKPSKMLFERSWGILERADRVQEVPRGCQRGLEAAQKRPCTAQGVPKSASGTPKDAAKAPQAASDWLFLVADGPLDSSPVLLQKSSFYNVKS